MIDNRFFVAFIRFINHAVLDFLPKSSSTLRKWVIDEYKRQKEIKKETIRRSRSRISISFDTWTAPFAKKHIISVIAHFVDENWERRHLQLSMSRLFGGHSGESVANYIVPILRDWRIDGSVCRMHQRGIKLMHLYNTALGTRLKDSSCRTGRKWRRNNLMWFNLR